MPRDRVGAPWAWTPGPPHRPAPGPSPDFARDRLGASTSLAHVRGRAVNRADRGVFAPSGRRGGGLGLSGSLAAAVRGARCRVATPQMGPHLCDNLSASTGRAADPAPCALATGVG